jgi:sodium/potassium-transporting ATPase subunit alpha
VAAKKPDGVISVETEESDDESAVDVALAKEKPAQDPNQTMASLFTGNPSECALLSFFEGFRPGTVAQLRSVYPFIFEIPFNSKNKYHVVVVNGSLSVPTTEAGAGKRVYTVFMKGAPEVLMQRCTKFIRNGEVHDADKDFQDSALEAYPYFARRGQRVLGFCYTEFVMDEDTELSVENVPIDGMTFVGMLAIMDPPRDDVPGAIVNCRSAGVKVFMVTGDHQITASAIAVQIGLLPEDVPVSHYKAGTSDEYDESEGEASLAVHGQQIESFDEDDWSFVLGHKNLVFARTTPQHKLLITEKCQERKEVVCMTGDGVNDAPALKRADIGVSMGVNGSQVARDASDVILMDDNFASIVLGIEAGRQLYDNLKKTIAYTLCHLGPEVLPILLTLAFGFPPLLSSLQILSIDLFTELAPAISLAYERKERDIMEQKPRNLKKDRLVSAPLLTYAYLISGLMCEATACFIGSCIVFWVNGIAIPDVAFVDENFFVDQNPSIIVPGWGNFVSNGNVFTPTEQINILFQAAGAWYIILVSSQILHIWMIKTRRTSLFKHSIFGNMVMNYGVILEAALMIVFVAIPGLNDIIMRCLLPPGLAVLPIIYSFVFLWVYNEGRKWYIRRHRKGWFARAFVW